MFILLNFKNKEEARDFLSYIHRELHDNGWREPSKDVINNLYEEFIDYTDSIYEMPIRRFFAYIYFEKHRIDLYLPDIPQHGDEFYYIYDKSVYVEQHMKGNYSNMYGSIEDSEVVCINDFFLAYEDISRRPRKRIEKAVTNMGDEKENTIEIKYEVNNFGPFTLYIFDEFNKFMEFVVDPKNEKSKILVYDILDKCVRNVEHLSMQNFTMLYGHGKIYAIVPN